MLRSRSSAFACAALALLTACAQPASPPASVAAPVTRDARVDAAAALGREIINDPRTYLPHNVVANMTCASCHLQAGTQARGGSFVGAFARFPQWNKRAHRVIALQDRLAECFLYSMNGTPPAYSSKAMVAMVAYIASLSRGVPVGTPQDPALRFVVPLPKRPAVVAAGSTLYAQRCMMCHGADGSGRGTAVPPLWGATSFNEKAGMARLENMTGFVYYNMPQNAPKSLSVEQAYDISAFVLTHRRPHFVAARSVSSPPQRADSI